MQIYVKNLNFHFGFSPKEIQTNFKDQKVSRKMKAEKFLWDGSKSYCKIVHVSQIFHFVMFDLSCRWLLVKIFADVIWIHCEAKTSILNIKRSTQLCRFASLAFLWELMEKIVTFVNDIWIDILSSVIGHHLSRIL